MKGRKDQQLFKRLAEDIEARILSGEYPPEQAIPSIRDLAGTHQVAPMTVHRAVRHLASNGRVRILHGVGTFPANDCPLDAIVLVTEESNLATQLEATAERQQGTLMDIMAGTKRACSEHGLLFITATERDDPQKFLNKRVGFLFHFVERASSPLLRWVSSILTARAPSVAIYYDVGMPNFVDRDLRAAYETGMRYVYGLGHRRVLLLPRIFWNEGRAALEPWPLTGMEDMTVRSHPLHGLAHEACEKAIADLIPEFFSGAPEGWPTAVFAGPGAMGRPAVSALERAGIRVPQDCSVLALCSAEHAQMENRVISRVDNAWQAIAHRAVKELLGIAATGRNPGRVLVAPELMPGNTCAHAATAATVPGA